MRDDKFKGTRDGYGALKGEMGWLAEMLGSIRETHGSYIANRDGFVSMGISIYDIESLGDEIVKDFLVLYQARFSAGKSGAKAEERQRKIKFHLALMSPDRRVIKTKAIETPHGIIRRWIEEGKSPLSLLETREPQAKTF